MSNPSKDLGLPLKDLGLSLGDLQAIAQLRGIKAMKVCLKMSYRVPFFQ